MMGFGCRRQPMRVPRAKRRPALPLESLETRRLLSTAAATDTTITPSTATIVADWSHFPPPPGFGGGGGTTPVITNPTPASTALTPSKVASAYSISAASTTGAGETIAIVIAGNDPNIQSDLAAFDSYYGLSTASLTVENQNGQTSGLPQTDAGWSLEAAMDVEWAHAAAQGAKLILVEANSASASDLMTAVQTAAKQANVVSMSWGGSEFQGQTAYDTAAYFANPNVTFVAASGDSGASIGASWPASSSNVVGVGGTTLSPTSAETAWSSSGSAWTGYSGSGGGTSLYESLPSYQSGVVTGTKRATPDVSADANPSTGLAVYDTVPGEGQTGWFQVGGTSAGAPVWAGVIAAADQERAAVGKSQLSSSQTLSLLYGLSKSSGTYSTDFHDVTSGSNLVASAKSGYDMVTGLGSPVASKIVAAAASTTIAGSVKAADVSIVIVIATPTTPVTKSLVTASPSSGVAFVVTAPILTPLQALAPVGQNTLSAASTTGASAIAAANSSAYPSLPAQPVASSTPSTRLSLKISSNSNTFTLDETPDGSSNGMGAGTTARPGGSRNERRLPYWDEVLEKYFNGLAPPAEANPAPAPPAAPMSLDETATDPEAGARPVMLAGAVVVAVAAWRHRARRTEGDREEYRRKIVWDRPFFF